MKKHFCLLFLCLLNVGVVSAQSFFQPRKAKTYTFRCTPDSIYAFNFKSLTMQKAPFLPVLEVSAWDSAQLHLIKVTDYDVHHLVKARDFDDSHIIDTTIRTVYYQRKGKHHIYKGYFPTDKFAPFLKFPPDTSLLQSDGPLEAYNALLPKGHLRFQSVKKMPQFKSKVWVFSAYTPRYEFSPFEFGVHPRKGFLYFKYKDGLNPYIYCECEQFLKHKNK